MIKHQAIGLILFCLADVSQADVERTRGDDLIHLVKHDCGSCHGISLRGGLAPPLTPAALAGRTPEALAKVIWEGRPGTAMPPWQGLLSKHDVDWIAKRLLAGLEDDDP